MNYSNEPFIQKHRQQIVATIAALFAIIIIWAIAIYVGRIGKTPLVVSLVPSDATVIIDGQRHGNGTLWLNDGTYQMTIEKEGFETQKKSVLVTNQKKQNVAAVSLQPKSDEAKKWAEKHQNDYTKNEQYGAIEARTNGEYFTDKNPITTKLPFKDPYFTIGYRTEKDDSITITVVTPSPRYRFYAVEQIRQWGYDPTDFVIDFQDFHNPLEAK